LVHFQNINKINPKQCNMRTKFLIILQLLFKKTLKFVNLTVITKSPYTTNQTIHTSHLMLNNIHFTRFTLSINSTKHGRLLPLISSFPFRHDQRSLPCLFESLSGGQSFRYPRGDGQSDQNGRDQHEIKIVLENVKGLRW